MSTAQNTGRENFQKYSYVQKLFRAILSVYFLFLKLLSLRLSVNKYYFKLQNKTLL